MLDVVDYHLLINQQYVTMMTLQCKSFTLYSRVIPVLLTIQ